MWIIELSAPCSRQTTTPAPHHSVSQASNNDPAQGLDTLKSGPVYPLKCSKPAAADLLLWAGGQEMSIKINVNVIGAALSYVIQDVTDRQTNAILQML